MTDEHIRKMMDAADERDKAIRESMPAEEDAIKQMFWAWLRLKQLGWHDTQTAPPLGEGLSIVEIGCASMQFAQFHLTRSGYIYTVFDGDIWPGATPVMWRLRKPSDRAVNLSLLCPHALPDDSDA